MASASPARGGAAAAATAAAAAPSATAGKVPVTVLTGFLGSGKTTLVNYILTQQHGKKIAVIENEFGEIGVDDALVRGKYDSEQQIIEMNNGCICCTVRGDLIRILTTLSKRASTLDAILIETTGLADPAPVAQTFFMSEDIAAYCYLDAIVTMCDAAHIAVHLAEVKPEGVENEAVEQVAFADVLLLNKMDLLPGATRAAKDAAAVALETQLRSINAVAKILRCENAVVPLDAILGIKAFDLSRVLETEPEFLSPDQEHQHDASVTSVGLTCDEELDQKKIQAWLSKLLRERGTDIFRSKGVLAMRGVDDKVAFQGVHMLMNAEPLSPWKTGEPRVSRMVFIGRHLNREELTAGFRSCLAPAAAVTRSTAKFTGAESSSR